MINLCQDIYSVVRGQKPIDRNSEPINNRLINIGIEAVVAGIYIATITLPAPTMAAKGLSTIYFFYAGAMAGGVTSATVSYLNRCVDKYKPQNKVVIVASRVLNIALALTGLHLTTKIAASFFGPGVQLTQWAIPKTMSLKEVPLLYLKLTVENIYRKKFVLLALIVTHMILKPIFDRQA